MRKLWREEFPESFPESGGCPVLKMLLMKGEYTARAECFIAIELGMEGWKTGTPLNKYLVCHRLCFGILPTSSRCPKQLT